MNPQTSAIGTYGRRLLIVIALGAAATAVVVTSWAQSPDGELKPAASTGDTADVERTERGDILHRRLPGGGGGDFIYDPQATETSLPSELRRDGNTHAAPKLKEEAEEGEAVYSDKGVRPAEPLVPPDSVLAAPPGAPTEPDPTARPVTEPVPAPAPTTADASTTPPTNTGPPVVDPRAFLGNRAAPDRQTHKEGRLDYHTVFDPSIVPFKRNRALNRVTSEYEVVLHQGHSKVVTPLGIRTEAGREAFWGSIVLPLSMMATHEQNS